MDNGQWLTNSECAIKSSILDYHYSLFNCPVLVHIHCYSISSSQTLSVATTCIHSVFSILLSTYMEQYNFVPSGNLELLYVMSWYLFYGNLFHVSLVEV